MDFNVLIDPLPTVWEGVNIKTDFRQALRFYRLMSDKSMSDRQKSEVVLKLFFDTPPQSGKTWDFIQFYLSGGKESPDENDGGEKLFDFEIDAGRVLAAFAQAYGIDLASIKMHWWQFLELFKALPDTTLLSKVIEIRGKEIPKDGDRKYIRDLRKAKRAYALTDPDPHRLADIFKGATNG
jgi:hypothetical protein